MNIGKLKRSTQIAIMTGAGSGAVEKTVTGTAPLTLSDSVAGSILGITVNGRSEVSVGSIVSVGEGWATVDLGTLTWMYSSTYEIFISSVITDMISQVSEGRKGFCSKYKTIYLTSSLNEMQNGDIVISSSRVDSSSGSMRVAIKDINYTDTDTTAFKNSLNGVILCYQLADPTQGNTLAVKTDDGTGIDGTMTTITTGLPLRSTLDGTVYDELTSTKVITRCEVVNNEVVPLAEPVEIPLSSAELAALTALKTYDPTTIISVTDNPSITVKYMGKNITRTAPKKRSSRKKKA